MFGNKFCFFSLLSVLLVIVGTSTLKSIISEQVFAATGDGGSGGDGTVDCTVTLDDPSCKVDCTKNPDDILCEVDCTTNPDDPLCKGSSPSPELASNNSSTKTQTVNGFSHNSDSLSKINEEPTENTITENVIRYNTSLADIPGVAGGEDLTVDTMLSGCDYTVSNGGTASIDAKAPCDVVIRYVVNYCLSHMNDTMAMENKQICWDNAMDSGLKYAVKWLDGGTGVMLKAQSDIMATKANGISTLPKDTLISRCEANSGFKFSPDLAAVMSEMPLETLRKTCG